MRCCYTVHSKTLRDAQIPQKRSFALLNLEFSSKKRMKILSEWRCTLAFSKDSDTIEKIGDLWEFWEK